MSRPSPSGPAATPPSAVRSLHSFAVSLRRQLESSAVHRSPRPLRLTAAQLHGVAGTTALNAADQGRDPAQAAEHRFVCDTLRAAESVQLVLHPPMPLGVAGSPDSPRRRGASGESCDASDLQLLSSVESLELHGGVPSGLIRLRSQLQTLTCSGGLRMLSELLAPPPLPGEETVGAPVWPRLKRLSCVYNTIRALDNSLELVDTLEYLDISHNEIGELTEHLRALFRLRYLNAGFNRITSLSRLCECLGQVSVLIVRNNELLTLDGLERMYALEHLDARENIIAAIDHVRPLANLPQLQQVWLAGNPVAHRHSYRADVLCLFGDRAYEIALDDRVADAADRAAVRQRVPPTPTPLAPKAAPIASTSPRRRVSRRAIVFNAISATLVPETPDRQEDPLPPIPDSPLRAATVPESPSEATGRDDGGALPTTLPSAGRGSSAAVSGQAHHSRGHRLPGSGMPATGDLPLRRCASAMGPAPVASPLRSSSAQSSPPTPLLGAGSARDLSLKLQRLRDEVGSSWLLVLAGIMDNNDTSAPLPSVPRASLAPVGTGAGTDMSTPTTPAPAEPEASTEDRHLSRSLPTQLASGAPLIPNTAESTLSTLRCADSTDAAESVNAATAGEGMLPASAVPHSASNTGDSVAVPGVADVAPTASNVFAAISAGRDVTAPRVPLEIPEHTYLADIVSQGRHDAAATKCFLVVGNDVLREVDTDTGRDIGLFDLGSLLAVQSPPLPSHGAPAPALSSPPDAHRSLVLHFVHSRGDQPRRRYNLESEREQVELRKLLEPYAKENRRNGLGTLLQPMLQCMACRHTFSDSPLATTRRCERCNSAVVVEVQPADTILQRRLSSPLIHSRPVVATGSRDGVPCPPPSLAGATIVEDDGIGMFAMDGHATTGEQPPAVPPSGSAYAVRGSPGHCGGSMSTLNPTPLSAAGSRLVEPSSSSTTGADSGGSRADDSAASGPECRRSSAAPPEHGESADAAVVSADDAFGSLPRVLLDRSEFTDIDHREQFYLCMQLFGDDAEKFQCQLRSRFVVQGQGKGGLVTGRLVLTTHRAYVIRETGRGSPDESFRPLASHALRALSHVDMGLGRQSLRIEFRHDRADGTIRNPAAYHFAVGCAARCQTFLVLLLEVLQLVERDHPTHLVQVQQHADTSTLRHFQEQVVRAIGPDDGQTETDEEESDRRAPMTRPSHDRSAERGDDTDTAAAVGSVLAITLAQMVTEASAAELPLTMVIFGRGLLCLCTQNLCWPLPHYATSAAAGATKVVAETPVEPQFVLRVWQQLRNVWRLEILRVRPNELVIVFDGEGDGAGVANYETSPALSRGCLYRWHLRMATPDAVALCGRTLARLWNELFRVSLQIAVVDAPPSRLAP